MDRADYFKKKGSTVDTKFARLHRRSIDQRAIRNKTFMDHRKMDDISFSPVKENPAKTLMPPPTSLPQKAKKGKGASGKPPAKEPDPRPRAKTGASAAAPPPAAAAAAAGMTRREKLMKWKEEKEMKKRQMAMNSKKPQVFRVSKAMDRKSEVSLFRSDAKAAQKPTGKVTSAPVTRTRSSTRTTSATVKDAGRTKAPAKVAEPVPTKRPRRGPVSAPVPPQNGPATRSSTRQSARLAARQGKPVQTASKQLQPAQTRSRQPNPVQTRSKREAAKQLAANAKPPKEEKVDEEEEEDVEEEKIESEPQAEIVQTELSQKVTRQRGPTLMDTFIPSGFSFSMDLPDIPFTPISPASASSFLFPMASASSSSVTQSRRCSTPYSRDLRRRRSQMDQENTESKLPVMDPLTAATTFNVSRAVNATAAIPSIGEENEAKETSEVEKMEIQTLKENEVVIAMEKKEADVPATTAIPSTTSGPTPTVADQEPKPTSASQGASPSKSSAPPAEQEKTPPAADQDPEKDVPYFKNLVSMETDRLLGRCKVWEDLMSSEDLSDEVCGEIRSASGKAKLLIDQRFKQFRGLINDCEFGLGEKATHCSDLAGFWEMVYFQVEDVDALFKELETLKANGWKREEKIETKPKVIKKKKPIAKKSGAASSAAGRNAARERLMAAKAAMKAKATRKAEAEKVVFEGGFFKVESPARKAVRDHCGAGSPFKTSKQVTPSSRVATPRVHTPRLLATPRNSPAAAGATNTTTTTPKVSHNTPTVAQLFSPMVEPRRSLRTKLCGEISKLVLSDKKATPTRRTPSVVNKENEVDLSLYLQPSMSVVDLNQQAEDLMVTEPADQLEQLGARSPAKNLRSRRSVAKAADPISPAVGTRSQALRNSTNTLGTNLCSPSRRKTRKSSLGFGLSAAASLFTPSTTPVPCEVVDDLISFD